MNKKMVNEMQNLSWEGKGLPPELSHILDLGFINRDGCILLASLAKLDTNVSKDDFPDNTGYECFINSIHIDDYTQHDYIVTACLFVEALFSAWKKSFASSPILAIISSDGSGALVKFHVVRDGESWVSQELDGYEEAILVTDSCANQRAL